MSASPPRAFDAALAWSHCLYDPLLTPRDRAVREDAMLTVCFENPTWAAGFYGGVIADLARSLPDEDPWRHLSGRVGSMTVGQNPPERDGAVRPDGARFGDYVDATDITPLSFRTVEADPALAALAEPLAPQSAALVAFGELGWEIAGRAVKAVHETPHPVAVPGSGIRVVSPTRYSTGVAGHHLRDTARDAVRWLVHRRRGYVGAEDTWVMESVFRWAWRCDQIAASLSWPVADVEPGIAAERVATYDPVAPVVGEQDF